MAPKRSLEPHPTEQEGGQKRRKGFRVGPANLPDGTYKRKVEKIKKDLIHKAKVRKSYAKLKERQAPQHQESSSAQIETLVSSSLELHPQRQAMLEEPGIEQPSASNPPANVARKNKRYQPFAKEARLAEKRKAELEARQAEHEEAMRQRKARMEERERFRKAMAKARSGGKNGQRKLGRESGILLERIRRTVNES